MAYFQAVCIVVALMSWLLMRYTGNNVQAALEVKDDTAGGNHCHFLGSSERPFFVFRPLLPVVTLVVTSIFCLALSLLSSKSMSVVARICSIITFRLSKL